MSTLEERVVKIIGDAKIQVFKAGSSYSTAEADQWGVMVESESIKAIVDLIETEKKASFDEGYQYAYDLEHGNV